MNIPDIVFIGAGNLAEHLAKAMKKKGFNIRQVFALTQESANLLALQVGAEPHTDLSEIKRGADLYVVAVPDHAIEKVISRLPLKDEIIVHTSGSVDMDILKNVSEHYGVFYPLQTFTKGLDVSFEQIPLCIEGNNEQTTKKIERFAGCLSEQVKFISSEQRQVIHLSAVFACNFTNYLCTIAFDLMRKSHLDVNLLRPLIAETLNKIQYQWPEDVQTGPARRKDLNTIQKHLDMMNSEPVYRQIYQLLTEGIQYEKNMSV